MLILAYHFIVLNLKPYDKCTISVSIGTIYIHCHIKFSACRPDFCVSLLNSHSEHGIINIDDQKCRLIRYSILLLMKSIFDLL